LERDKNELEDFKFFIQQLEVAWKQKDVAEVNNIKNNLVAAMNREISQRKAKNGQE